MAKRWTISDLVRWANLFNLSKFEQGSAVEGLGYFHLQTFLALLLNICGRRGNMSRRVLKFSTSNGDAREPGLGRRDPTSKPRVDLINNNYN